MDNEIFLVLINERGGTSTFLVSHLVEEAKSQMRGPSIKVFIQVSVIALFWFSIFVVRPEDSKLIVHLFAFIHMLLT